jgi:hypothetical protein
MKNLTQIEFSGEYRVFYPELDIDDGAKAVIKLFCQKMFGSTTKVFFTDDSTPSLLLESSATPSQVPNYTPPQRVVSVEQVDASPEPKVSLADAQMKRSGVVVPRDEGRVTSW